ncbi:MAG: response regulator transcription factor [Verrucomicrobia bacterium]|nr:response regulator transcription factor [Verrucomicrobiota bacterium]
MPKIKLLLADDHTVIRLGLKTATNDQPDMVVVADVESGTDAIEAYRVHRPDVVVADLRMQGMGGIETTQKLRELFGDVHVLIFSNYAKGEEIFQAMRAGALGFVLKEMSMSRLLEAIRTVAKGERYMPPEIAMKVGERMLFQLSPREIDVLRLVAKGMSNKEIGNQLGVVEGTVKIHVANIFAKMGVSDRTHAIVLASKRGIIDID